MTIREEHSWKNIMYDWFSKNSDLLLEDLFSFLRFKSISADSSYSKEVIGCAEWLKKHLSKIGLDSQLLKTDFYPVVFARNKDFDEKKPTVLIYGHYDVQPVDPLDEWNSSPFDPKIVNGEIYARGASDDKGQIFFAVCAVQYFLSKYSKLPFNIKFCIEGEEEFASKGLHGCLTKYKDLLKADYLFAIDFGANTENVPAITLGARGLASMSVEFIGSNTDFHSGGFGGIAYNPLRACVEVLSKLWDSKGRVAVPGFYDDVKLVDSKKVFANTDIKKLEKEMLMKFEKEFNMHAFHNEEGFSSIESNWFRPTLEINGIGGGYFDAGFKTVIPKKVICKISARLVKNQNPVKISSLIKDFLQKQTKKGIELKIDILEGGSAIGGDVNGKFTQALTKSMEEIYGCPCEYIYCGGSVPIVSSMLDTLKAEPTMLGLALASDNIHAPNEHFSLKRFERGFLSVARTLEVFGRM